MRSLIDTIDRAREHDDANRQDAWWGGPEDDTDIQELANASLRYGGAEAYEVISEAVAEDLWARRSKPTGMPEIDQRNARRFERTTRQLAELGLALADGDEATVGRIMTDVIREYAYRLECGTQAKAISEGRSRDPLHTRRHEWLLAEMTAARKLSRVLAAVEEVKA